MKFIYFGALKAKLINYIIFTNKRVPYENERYTSRESSHYPAIRLKLPHIVVASKYFHGKIFTLSLG